MDPHINDSDLLQLIEAHKRLHPSATRGETARALGISPNRLSRGRWRGPVWSIFGRIEQPGRVHIAASGPIALQPESRLEELAERYIALQLGTATHNTRVTYRRIIDRLRDLLGKDPRIADLTTENVGR